MPIHTTMDFKAEHDNMLAAKPESVEHDADNCQFCISSEGGDMSKTYTEDEVKAVVEEALAPVLAELDAIRASEAEEAIAIKVAEAVAAKDAEISELHGTIDTLTLRAETAEADYASVIAWLEAEAQAAVEAAELAARRDERLAAVKEVASFAEDYIEANADRWVSLDDAAFASLLEDWKAVAALSPAVVATEGKDDDEIEVPVATAIEASRANEVDKWSDVREMMRMPLRGIDLKTL
jgi:hypothetical protein